MVSGRLRRCARPGRASNSPRSGWRSRASPPGWVGGVRRRSAQASRAQGGLAAWVVGGGGVPRRGAAPARSGSRAARWPAGRRRGRGGPAPAGRGGTPRPAAGGSAPAPPGCPAAGLAAAGCPPSGPWWCGPAPGRSSRPARWSRPEGSGEYALIPRGWLARRPACRGRRTVRAAPLGGRAAARAGLAKRPGDQDHPGDDSRAAEPLFHQARGCRRMTREYRWRRVDTGHRRRAGGAWVVPRRRR